ncbi:MAG: hypothetical protein E7Z89_01955 [Cyanobacteria bacterium SIG28]|nr:hypothetical protein [Cyanobacteria bacterium SIG28]
MVNISTNYNAYVDFYNKHKNEIETTGTVQADKDVKLAVDIQQIYNLMKNEGVNAVLAVVEQLKAQGVAVEGPNINFNDGTVTLKIANSNIELSMAEGETVETDTQPTTQESTPTPTPEPTQPPTQEPSPTPTQAPTRAPAASPTGGNTTNPTTESATASTVQADSTSKSTSNYPVDDIQEEIKELFETTKYFELSDNYDYTPLINAVKAKDRETFDEIIADILKHFVDDSRFNSNSDFGNSRKDEFAVKYLEILMTYFDTDFSINGDNAIKNAELTDKAVGRGRDPEYTSARYMVALAKYDCAYDDIQQVGTDRKTFEDITGYTKDELREMGLDEDFISKYLECYQVANGAFDYDNELIIKLNRELEHSINFLQTTKSTLASNLKLNTTDLDTQRAREGAVMELLYPKEPNLVYKLDSTYYDDSTHQAMKTNNSHNKFLEVFNSMLNSDIESDKLPEAFLKTIQKEFELLPPESPIVSTEQKRTTSPMSMQVYVPALPDPFLDEVYGTPRDEDVIVDLKNLDTVEGVQKLKAELNEMFSLAGITLSNTELTSLLKAVDEGDQTTFDYLLINLIEKADAENKFTGVLDKDKFTKAYSSIFTKYFTDYSWVVVEDEVMEINTIATTIIKLDKYYAEKQETEEIQSDMEVVQQLQEETNVNEALEPYANLLKSYEGLLDNVLFDENSEASDINITLANNYLALSLLGGHDVSSVPTTGIIHLIEHDYPDLVKDVKENPVLNYLYPTDEERNYLYYRSNISPYEEYMTSYTIFYQFKIFTEIMNELLTEYNKTEKTNQDYNNLVQQLAERLQVELPADVLKY